MDTSHVQIDNGNATSVTHTTVGTNTEPLAPHCDNTGGASSLVSNSSLWAASGGPGKLEVMIVIHGNSSEAVDNIFKDIQKHSSVKEWIDVGNTREELQEAGLHKKLKDLKTKVCLWIHFDNNVTQEVSGTIRSLVKLQIKNQGMMILDAQTKQWPKTLRTLITEPAHIYTCGLACEECFGFKFWTTPRLKEIRCTCGSEGDPKRLTKPIDGKFKIAFEAVARYLLSAVGQDEGLINPSPVLHSVDQACQAAYPTEQAIRSKQVRKERQEQLAKDGLTKEEIKAATKRKKQPQEHHYDDCGSDIELLEEREARSLLALPGGELDEAVAFCFGNDCHWGDDEEEAEQYLRSLDSLNYLVGFQIEETTEVDIMDLCTYLQRRTEHLGRRKHVDVIQLFGGEGGVLKIAIRRNLVTGQNFDIVTGFDLRNRDHEKALYEYIELCKPMVVIASPPCTAFGKLSQINRVNNYERWKDTRRDGERLGRITATVCEMQHRGRRYYLVENPKGSELFKLKCFQDLKNNLGRFHDQVVFPQCAVGLMNPERTLPLLKETELWANHGSLITHFANYSAHTRHTDTLKANSEERPDPNSLRFGRSRWTESSRKLSSALSESRNRKHVSVTISNT